MIYEFSSMADFDKAAETNPEFQDVVSPGGAIGGRFKSRQSVYGAIKRGKLDLIRIKERGDSLVLLIPVASIERYNQISKVGRPPKLSSSLKCTSDKLLGYWPSP